ncbi:MAG: adenylate/guanylate cyclase domain-containing protein [Ruegeria sp.]|uniref:AAA family ATPase n=1 Tax=Ruegeria sp. TaxID=1879320 RepID=UPI00349E4BF6
MVGFRAWLESVSLEAHHDKLAANSIDLEIITELSEPDLIELGLNLGDRKRMLRAINDLRQLRQTGPDAPLAEAKPHRTSAYSNGDVSERRQLTLMFVDLVGSTQLSTALNLEDYKDALHVYQDCCQEIIRARHGHVANLIGDGLVCYFGYPRVEENDAERAVFAGLEICRAVSQLRLKDGQRLQVRIGISSGDVVVDENASHGSLALGDVPNLAARVQAVADPGTVAISDSTKQLIGENITCQWMGHHALKGFQDEVGIWQVVTFDSNRLRFQARQSGRKTPLVDRKDELQLLESQWKLAKRGEGRAVMLSGEAGIGKSRLVEAIAEKQITHNSLRLGFQCLPNHEASSYYPVISLISSLARISRSDAPATKLSKLRKFVSGWSLNGEITVDVLARLLSVPVTPTERNPDDVSPDQLKERVQETLIRVILALTNQRPVLLLIEDIHWIDPSTEEIVDLLIERLKSTRVLIVCTFRPTYRARWTGLAGVMSLTLSRFDEKHMREMLDNLLEQGKIVPEIETQIISKTDGVPLFVEEMARHVRDRYTFRLPDKSGGPLTLPSTLKELLQATIDKIDSARRLLPICAAIGNNISVAMLQAVVDDAHFDTQMAIDRMVDEQILVPHGSKANRVYSFRHSLIRDAAYELMLPSRARNLHRRIAEVMAGSFVSYVKDHPELLAQHYSLAGMPANARDCWRDAAKISTSRSATEETIQHLNSALGENEKIEDPHERRTQEISLRKMFNVALNTQAFGSKQVIKNFRRMHDLLRKTDADIKDSFLALHVQYGAQIMLGQPKSARGLCEDMNTLADQENDPTMLTIAAHDTGMCDFMLGNLNASIAAFDRALSLRPHGSQKDILRYHAADVRMVDVSMRCWARTLAEGDTPEVRAELDAALANIRAEPHEFSRCYGLNILAAAYQILDDSTALLELVQEAANISDKRKFQYWHAWGGILRGWARARQGEHAAGTAHLRQAIEDYLETGSTQILPYARTLLADTYLMTADFERGLLAIKQVRQDENTLTVRYQVPITDRVEAALQNLQAQKT